MCAGDSIVVELLPESQWKSESSRLPGKAAADIMAEGEDADGKDEEDEEAGDSEFCQVGGMDTSPCGRARTYFPKSESQVSYTYESACPPA